MMYYNTKIHFSGLMLFLPKQSSMCVIIPKVNTQKIDGHEIGDHIAYIAFRRGKAQPSNWMVTELPTDKKFDYVTLDGETVEFSMDGGPLSLKSFLPCLKNKHCKNLDKLKDEYGPDGPKAAGHVILKGGDDVGWHVTEGRRIETIVLMHHNKASLTLKATKKGSKDKSLRFYGEANVIIGNSDRSDFCREEPEKPHLHDFLFYYQMFETNAGCNSVPVPGDELNNPNVKDPVIDLPPIRAIDIACSNSQYP